MNHILLFSLIVIFSLIFLGTGIYINRYINCTIKCLECNHYKFKSDEEYKNRMIAFNTKDGYMSDKLNNSKTNSQWMIESNKRINTSILKYLEPLKTHMSSTLKQVIPYSKGTKYKYNI